MFTGIVEETGTIQEMRLLGTSGRIRVKAGIILEDVKTGDSIAVNGVCLTASEVRPDGFTADVMAETVRRSSLGTLAPGQRVNLERAMAANGRFGGHIVTGHIDDTGIILERRREENAVWVTIGPKNGDLSLIVEKGSIAIDGISLTVAKKDQNAFRVSIIPHTGMATTLLEKREGDTVNLEYDIIGKYVRQMLAPAQEGNAKESGLTLEMLSEYGF